MTGQRPVLTNDPPNDPRSGGLPFGHAGLEAFLGLPFLVDDNLVGATSLGDRPGGYSEREVETARATMRDWWAANRYGS